jgi:hypothetical protein
MKREEVEARYQQVLEWRAQGVGVPEIAERLGVSPARIYPLYAKALQWSTTHTALLPDTEITALRVDRRAIAGLQRRGITAVGHVATLSDDDLLQTRGVGPDVLAQIRADLAARYDPEHQSS